MAKRATESDASDLQRKLLRNAFQDNAPDPRDVIQIYLNNTHAYTTDRDVIMRCPDSVMCKSLQAGMSEAITSKIVIQDDDSLYTIAAVKLLFTALKHGTSVMMQSIFDPYDTVVLPFLAHYLCLDQDAEGAGVAKFAVEQYARLKCSDGDINKIMTSVLPAANTILSILADENPCRAFFLDIKRQLLRLIAQHTSCSTSRFHFAWSHLAGEDLCAILDKVRTVVTALCYRTQKDAAWCVSDNSVGAQFDMETSNRTIKITWKGPGLHLFSGAIVPTGSLAHEIPSTLRAVCRSSFVWNANKGSDKLFAIYHLAWQTRYEILMTYLHHTNSDAVPEEYRVTPEDGMTLNMCLRGILSLRTAEVSAATSAMLRCILIETAAAILRIGHVEDFDSFLISHLTSIDVLDIVRCEAVTPEFGEICYAKSNEYDVITFLILWKGAAPDSTNSDRPTFIDAVALVKLYIRSIDFRSRLALGTSSKRRQVFIDWLTSHAGEDMQDEVITIMQALCPPLDKSLAKQT